MGLKTALTAAGALALANAASAQVAIPNNSVADRAALGVGTSFVALDLSSAGFLNGAVNNGINSYSEDYIGNFGNFSGNLTVEVFGNQSALGAGLTDVLLIYTFTGSAISPLGAEQFDFSVDGGSDLDFGTLKDATQGSILDQTTLVGGQLDPAVSVTDNLMSSDTWTFSFDDGDGTTGEPTDQLGGGGQFEQYTWYVQTSGDVKLNFVDVLVTDFGGVTISSLGLVLDSNTPNLGTIIPLPSAAGMGLVGLGVIASRRRR